MRIAVIAEMAPAKAFIPIIKQLDADIIGLTCRRGYRINGKILYRNTFNW